MSTPSICLMLKWLLLSVLSIRCSYWSFVCFLAINLGFMGNCFSSMSLFVTYEYDNGGLSGSNLTVSYLLSVISSLLNASATTFFSPGTCQISGPYSSRSCCYLFIHCPNHFLYSILRWLVYTISF